MKHPSCIIGVRTKLGAKCGMALFLGLIFAGSDLFATDVQPEKIVRSASAPEMGTASYYADKYHGRPTASGEIFDMHKLTAAHPTLPFGTVIKVTHAGNNRSVIVRINDRGPFVAGRIIDLSLAAAEQLQMVEGGLASVKLEIISPSL